MDHTARYEIVLFDGLHILTHLGLGPLMIRTGISSILGNSLPRCWTETPLSPFWFDCFSRLDIPDPTHFWTWSDLERLRSHFCKLDDAWRYLVGDSHFRRLYSFQMPQVCLNLFGS